ncbi:unnamed protein product, partial [Urochloa humidicola]
RSRPSPDKKVAKKLFPTKEARDGDGDSDGDADAADQISHLLRMSLLRSLSVVRIIAANC